MYARIATALLAVSLLQSCGPAPRNLRISFVATYSGVPLLCDGDASIHLSDLRFYVYDVRLRDSAGRQVPLQLRTDSAWQQAGLALLDLENGEAECSDGTPEMHTVLEGTLPAGEYQGLSFMLGVPFELNHKDPLRAAAPLDDAAMHWHWRGGYKFLRAGVRSTDDGFWLHLGSTGCEGTLQDIRACSAPNRVSVQIDDFIPGRDDVAVDLSALAAPPELQDSIAQDCSSGPAETHCQEAFAALGLPFTGNAGADRQRVFARRSKP